MSTGPNIMRRKILVTRKLPLSVEKRIASFFDTQFNPNDSPLSSADLKAAMQNFDGLVPTVSDQLTADILRAPERSVKMIANVGVGFSNIDIETARRNEISVSNTPDVLTDATADIAMLLILASTRRAYAAEHKLRHQQWNGFSLVEGLGTSIQGKVLGIIGMGRIGRATAKRAALGFGMKIIYFNRSEVTNLEFDAKRVNTLSELMSVSDVVSVHVPGNPTSPLIKASDISQMKPSAYLVNTARGNSLDEDALIKALQDEKIAGAGLDVFTHEPNVPKALRDMKNVTLLPHIGSATIETRTAMGMLAVDNLEAFFAGKPLPNPVT